MANGHPDKDARLWAMLCHLSTFAGMVGIPFGNILGPLIIWLIKKDEYPFVDDQGKEALNFQISMTVYLIVSVLLCFVLVGFILLPIVAPMTSQSNTVAARMPPPPSHRPITAPTPMPTIPPMAVSSLRWIAPMMAPTAAQMSRPSDMRIKDL